MRASWIVSEYSVVPWWVGAIEPYELGVRVTVIPLNFVWAWGLWVRRGIQARWLPYRQRWDVNRKALRSSFERGRVVGYRQGRVAGMCEESARRTRVLR